VETATDTRKRRKLPWVIGVLMALSFTVLIVLQSSNLWKEMTIDTSSDLILLYALSSLNFVAFCVFAFVFLRSIIRLLRERRTFQMGAQIKTKLLVYFFAVSLMPIIAMAVFSYLFMNRSLERWFSQIPQNVMQQARGMERTYAADRIGKLDATAKMLAATLENERFDDAALAKIAEAGSLSHIEVLAPENRTLASSERDVPDQRRGEMNAIVAAVRSGKSREPSFSDGRGFEAAVAEMSNGRRLLIVPDPVSATDAEQIVDRSQAELDRLNQQQFTIRRVGLLTLGILTFLLIFASSWIAFYVARGLTEPIKALAEGADEIARGNLGHRVDVFAEDELALLVTTFNEMSATLESTSLALSERRKYIETVLETLPTGVISFDADDCVTTINRAAVSILRLVGEEHLSMPLAQLVNEHDGSSFSRLLARARRVGHASDQMSIKSDSNGSGANDIKVALTATKLPADGGVVLVIEDLSELISAQRAFAWQEVARRMAHEIKNPLTPIQLSAERIAKRFTKTGHVDVTAGKRINDKGPIGDVVHESTATILREVMSLKTMVDEFSRFARLPATKLEQGDLNEAIIQAAAVFDLPSADIDVELAADLPYVALDTEKIKQAFVNLIQNSLEANDNGGRPHIAITTRHDAARDLIVAEVTDSGRGIAPSDLQKLFQPYFSTKGRGTGLGLAIVHRIITEHHGKIKAVANQPKGARFIIELPANG
jgi:two-component system nitrogen regulation sensor histidine kinase NtrY